jgi:hypothetical protein
MEFKARTRAARFGRHHPPNQELNMLESRKRALTAYHAWIAEGHPVVDSAHVLTLAMGYIVDCTDDRPDSHEQALLSLLRRETA